MAQYIKQGNIFGRIGTGIGKGINEQLPKEIEHQRFRSGLQKLGENANSLSPMQAFLEASGTYGATPQFIQSFGELAKQQGLRQSYANAGRNKIPEKINSNSGFQGGVLTDQSQNLMDKSKILNGVQNKQAQTIVPSESEGTSLPQENPLRKEVIPAKPWEQDRWINEMADAQDLFPNMTNQELSDYVSKKEQRELAAPQAQRDIDTYKESIQDKSYKEFDDLLEKKLQKKGEKTFSDVPGTLQNKLKRKMINELINNKNANIKDVADKWTDLAYRRARALNNVKVDANKSFFSKSPSQVLSDLKSYSSIFKEIGDSENYKDLLIDNFKFSPQRASQIAYSPSKSANNYLNSIKRTPAIHNDITGISLKRANDLQGIVTPSDSIQSIAREIKDRDPYFNEEIFFQELKDIIAEDERNNVFTQRQKEEISKGSSDFLPNWADVWYFPLSHGIKTGAIKK